MPKLIRLARVVRLMTLPETRAVLVTAVRSERLHEIAHQARTDRGALLRDLRDAAKARDLAQRAARHPATRELATAGLLFLPVRYVPVASVATWLASKTLRRYLDQPADIRGHQRPAPRGGRAGG